MKVTTVLISLAFLLATGFTPAHGVEKRVLILDSYHHGYTWSDNEVEGILETLRRRDGIIVNIEYLDTKRVSKEEHFPEVARLLERKKPFFPPDLIMALDDPAFRFIITYRTRLYDRVPVVFAGLNDYSPSMLRGERMITGLVERQDFRGTVEAALKIQPETREVVVVHDETPSGQATHTEMEEQLAPIADRVRIRYLEYRPIEEITEQLKRLGKGSVVLLASFSRDAAGRLFNHDEISRIVSQSSPVPVYATKVERLGHGIIGGSLMEGKNHGAEAARIALSILTGTLTDAIPVVLSPTSRLMFDARVLERFDIPLDRLPEGSEVINTAPSFYEEHKRVIQWSGGSSSFSSPRSSSSSQGADADSPSKSVSPSRNSTGSSSIMPTIPSSSLIPPA